MDAVQCWSNLLRCPIDETVVQAVKGTPYVKCPQCERSGRPEECW